MSRVGQKPVSIPEGVAVSVVDGKVVVKGRLGEITQNIPLGVKVVVDAGKVSVVRDNDLAQAKSLQGLIRSLIVNMIKGIASGFSKDLEIQGVGFKAIAEKQDVLLSLGFSSPVRYVVPAGVKVAIGDSGTTLVVSGADKQAVGDAAARIRSFFPAEPYKGKGIRYKNEHVRRKVGKTVA